MSRISFYYRCLELIDEAVKILVKVLEVKKASLGQDHPKTLASISGLQRTYWTMGKREKAEELQKQLA
jgi:hypothetical protein